MADLMGSHGQTRGPIKIPVFAFGYAAAVQIKEALSSGAFVDRSNIMSLR